MATSNEIETLVLIKKIKREAKTKKINVAKYLSGGNEKYRSAINTVISVGALSAVISTILFAKVLFEMVFYIAQNGLPDSYLTYLILFCESAVFVTTAVLGGKLYDLDATPTFVLSSLIIILIANLALASGIFPLITAVLAIIGLVRWSTFKSWFYGVDKKRQNIAKQKKVSVAKTNNRAKLAENKYPKNKIWMIAFIISIIVAVGGSVGFYFLGNKHGLDNGNREGYKNGYSDGETSGYARGFSNGKSTGYNEGYNTGYDDGYNTMWKKAMCITSGGGSYCY